MDCIVERRKVVSQGKFNTRTGETHIYHTFTEVGPCGTPLFGEREKKDQICTSCYSGWSTDGNSLTARGHEQVKDARDKI